MATGSCPFGAIMRFRYRERGSLCGGQLRLPAGGQDPVDEPGWRDREQQAQQRAPVGARDGSGFWIYERQGHGPAASGRR
jgi:hypothetical protein